MRSIPISYRHLRLVFFLIAVGLAAGIIVLVGPKKIWDGLAQVGWRLGWIFLLGFPRYFLYTLSWRVFLKVPLTRLYQIKIAGELITRATPVHFLGGDAARVLLLGKGLPRETRAGSVIMDRTVMTLGAAVMVLAGLIIGTFALPLSIGPKLLLWLVVALLFWGLFFIVSHQKRSALVSLLGLLGKVGLGRWIRPQWKEKLAEVDQAIRSYYEKGHGLLALAVGINFLGRLLTATEIYLLMIFLEIPLGPLQAILCSSLSLLLTIAFFAFPGNIGVLEGTYAILFFTLGLDPALGVSMELLRKLNAVSWNLVGAVIALTLKREEHP